MNPFYKEQQRLQEALDLDRPRHGKVKRRGERNGGTTTFGAVIGYNTRNDTVEIAAFGDVFTMHEGWVVDNGDGTIRILNSAFRKHKRLGKVYRQHKLGGPKKV